MFDLPLLRACVQQQQILEELVKPPNIALEQDSVADAVQFYAGFADQLDRAQRRLLFAAGKVNHPESLGVGSLLTALIQAALARGYLLKKAVELAESNAACQGARPGLPVDREPDLFKAIERLQQLLAMHIRDWPQTSIPTRQEAVAAVEKKETQPLDEAFGEIAKISSADWSSFVEEHRRKHPTQRVG